MNKARYDVWDAAFERLDAEREVPTALHEAFLRPGLFEGLGPVAAQEEATYVVRYWLHGFDWSPIPPRGPAIADAWHSIEPTFGAQYAEEALRNYIPASRYDPDYREALHGIAVWHHEQGRLLPAPLAAWASQCYRGELPTPPKPRGDHGRPAYAQVNRNRAIAEVFHLLGYLGLHEKLTRYHAIGAEFGCSEEAVRKGLATHARWTGELAPRGNAGRRPGAQTRPRASRVMDGHVRQIVSIDLRRSCGTMRSMSHIPEVVMSEPQITHRPLATLTPWARNARTHSKKQIRQIADSIRQFGFTAPVLIDEAGTILAGHGRVAAARLLGLTEVPCLQIEHLSEAQKRAYVLADNKLALNANWDEDLLATELGALLATDLDLDISVTGFSIPEVDDLLATVAPEEPDDPADDALPDAAPARVHRGEVWQLGAHRLICGDVRDPAVLPALMAGEQARLVFTDPPYNVPIDGHAGGLGRIKHREFAMAAGEMSREAFTAFLQQALAPLAAHSVEGSIHYVCMDWRHLPEVLAAGEAVFTELKNLVVWVKDNGGMGTFYRSRHELIFVFKHGTTPHCNTFELGQHGRYRTNVWQYRGVNSRGPGRMADLAQHPTVKPVHLIADALRDVSGRGEIVLDGFGGSGSTLIAAAKTGRRARLCEIDPVYCDRILARWEAYATDDATRLDAGGPADAGGPEVAP